MSVTRPLHEKRVTPTTTMTTARVGLAEARSSREAVRHLASGDAPHKNPSQTTKAQTTNRKSHMLSHLRQKPTWTRGIFPRREVSAMVRRLLAARWLGYIAALGVEWCAVLVTFAMVSLVPGFSLLGAWELVAVALIALRWGVGPSLVATLEGALLLEFVVLPPHFSAKAADHSQWPEIASFVLAGLVLSLVITTIERRYRQAVAAEAQASARATAAREATERMDEFLSIVSHEMRNPLAYILATMQVVERKLKKLPAPPSADAAETERITELRELLRRGQRQVRVQDRLIGDLLDVSRLRVSTFDLHPGRCDVRAIARDVVASQRVAWPNREIALELCDDVPLEVTADEQRIAQVLTNYVTNALKYSPPSAPVVVRAEREGAASAPVRVLVRDAGPGLPPEECERIWDRFHRAAGVKPRDGNGASLGLGLHISRAIIDRHGGQVGVESEQGVGSTFWFTLPVRQAAPRTQ